MNIIRKAFKQIVDHYTMDPAWVQEEVNRLTVNGPNVDDIILKAKMNENL